MVYPRMILVMLALASASCTTKPTATVLIVPADRQLEAVVICPAGMTCVTEPGRWSISQGYLRDIQRKLVECDRQ